MADNRTIYVDIIGRDDASPVFRRVSAGIGQFANSANDSITRFNAALRGYNNSMYRFNAITTTALTGAGRAVYNFTKDSIMAFAELEKNHAKTMGTMYTNYAKTSKGQAQFYKDSDALRQQAIRLGQVGPNGNGSMYNAQDISYAQSALVKAGVSPKDIISTDAMANVMKFAGGNDLSLDTATEFAVSLGTQFEVPMKDWGKMLDKVTKAADISIIDVEDIIESMKYAGGISSGLKRPMDEVLGMLSVMGNAGLKGSMAGTGIQGVFTRMLATGDLTDTQLGKAPGISGQVFNQFKSEIVDSNQNMLPMEQISPLLDEAMGELNDTEQAWFAKKLFGLFQMKAAYALGRQGENGENLLADAIDSIDNMSDGTINAKWQLMLGSMYGNITALQNAWNSTKADMGSRLAPVVKSVSTELFNFLSKNGEYTIDIDKIRKSAHEANKLVSKQYGKQAGQFVEDVANTGINVGMVGGAVAPTVMGISGFTLKFLAGDFDGAFETLYNGIDNTNRNIDGLPKDLQDLARDTNRAALALSALAGINFAAKILESLTTIWRYSGGKLLSKITAARANINSTSTSMRSSTVTASIASMSASTNIMNVTAGVVNINGGANGGKGSGGGGTGGGAGAGAPSTPILPSGGGSGAPLLLPGGTGGKTVPGQPQLTGPKTYTWKHGDTTTTWSPNGKFGELAGRAGLTALALAAGKMAGSPGLFDTSSKRANDGNDWLDKYVSDGAHKGLGVDQILDNSNYQKNGMVSPYGNAYSVYYARAHKNYKMDKDGNDNSKQIISDTIEAKYGARQAMMDKYKSFSGRQEMISLMQAQIHDNGRITEKFLQNLTTYKKDGVTYKGTQADINELLRSAYNNFKQDYHPSVMSTGRFNENAVTTFVSGNKDYTTKIIDSKMNANTAQIAGAIKGMNINNKVNVTPPGVNVKVNVKVDKNGNVTQDVIKDYSGATNWMLKQSSRYSSK